MKNKWEDVMALIDKNDICQIVEQISKMKGDEYKYFTEKMIEEFRNTKNVYHRNTIAIVLGDLKCNDAIDVMIDFIKIPENRKCIGSILYALQELECEKAITEIIKVAFGGTYEAKCNMYALVEEKIYNMSQEDKSICLELLEKERCRLEEELEFIEDMEELF